MAAPKPTGGGNGDQRWQADQLSDLLIEKRERLAYFLVGALAFVGGVVLLMIAAAGALSKTPSPN